MIIDCILDRKERAELDGDSGYRPCDFYYDVLCYGGYYGKHITYVMDYLGEDMVQRALCEYVVGSGYNPEICDYINSVWWLIPSND